MPGDKNTVRRLALAARSRVTDREAAGRAAAERALALEEFASARTVLAFASFGAEIPTDPLLEGLLEAGRTVLLPYVEEGAMRAAPIDAIDDLVPGYRGIREPAQRVAPDAADIVVVPGVAFDARGARLGYGGGFYDRYLTGVSNALVVGYCFDAQIVDEVPTEPHDRAVDLVVTELRVVRPAG